MKIYIASDHAAFFAKKKIINRFKNDYELIDLGPESDERCDYPYYAKKVCMEVQKSECLGILLCGSGIGMSMSANRYKGIRASLCRDIQDAELAKLHNNANVLCLGGRVQKEDLLYLIIDKWLQTSFEGGRHEKRVALFNDLGE